MDPCELMAVFGSAGGWLGSGEASTSYAAPSPAAARPAGPLGTHSLADAAARAAPAVVNVTVQSSGSPPFHVGALAYVQHHQHMAFFQSTWNLLHWQLHA